MPDTELADLLAGADMTEVGRRIRQARVTKGLTQTELAAGEVSVGYVSRIESGKRRPDPGVLERMAGRLGMSPLVLLSGVPDPVLTGLQVALDHAELSLRGGSPAEAMQQLDAIWSDVVACGMPDLEGRARYARALTLAALGRLDEAVVELEELLASSPSDGTQSTRPTTSLSHLYMESGDLTKAIETGERHLEILRRRHLDGSEDAIRLLVTVTGAYFFRGDVAHAVRMCRRAIEKAEELDSPVAKASAYWNASMFEFMRGGSVEVAVPLAAKALRLMESADRDGGVAPLRSALGWLQLRLDPPLIEEARANLEAAGKQLLWTSAHPIDPSTSAGTTCTPPVQSSCRETSGRPRSEPRTCSRGCAARRRS